MRLFGVAEPHLLLWNAHAALSDPLESHLRPEHQHEGRRRLGHRQGDAERFLGFGARSLNSEEIERVLGALVSSRV